MPAEWQLVEKQVRAGVWTTGPRSGEVRGVFHAVRRLLAALALAAQPPPHRSVTGP